MSKTQQLSLASANINGRTLSEKTKSFLWNASLTSKGQQTLSGSEQAFTYNLKKYFGY